MLLGWVGVRRCGYVFLESRSYRALEQITSIRSPRRAMKSSPTCSADRVGVIINCLSRNKWCPWRSGERTALQNFQRETVDSRVSFRISTHEECNLIMPGYPTSDKLAYIVIKVADLLFIEFQARKKDPFQHKKQQFWTNICTTFFRFFFLFEKCRTWKTFFSWNSLFNSFCISKELISWYVEGHSRFQNKHLCFFEISEFSKTQPRFDNRLFNERVTLWISLVLNSSLQPSGRVQFRYIRQVGLNNSSPYLFMARI